MSVALFGFLALGISGRELAREVNLYQLLVYRNGLCLIIVLAILARSGFAVVRTQRIGRHIARNVVHLTGQYSWFFAVVWLPLSEVFAIEFTTPIWTALMASAFLGERVTAWRAAAIALGFLGVLVILRPGLAIVHPAALAAVAAAVCFAATYVITKNLVGHDRPMAILFWMHLIQLPLGLMPALASGWVNPSLPLWPYVAMIGIAGFGTHYCIARAMSFADATIVVPLDFLRLPIGAVIGWLFYAETLDPMVAAGAAIIIVANVGNLRHG